ncbi:sugar ABC transporter substrate-binding protein [Kineococcus aurantiacus]|uniref:Ribose transport system substrate-binding protein n=1 Tax=Kineococcus aurantiacus TaxID=37633 RepID=A0A7Y9J304_9ACTN|nr:sugar ABC transporter substrate-binding protein [Kineococcus aurantiacus]NYD24817.1 ribose transport system substrate-binding protein [Kineococcus aurantiacus]
MHEHVTRRTVIRSVSAALALAAAGSTAACGQSDTAAGQERLLIGVAQADTTVSFLATLDKAIEEEAEKLGMDTVILNGEYDNAVQAANVNQLVARKVDVILVISSSPTAVVPAIRNAADAGIPVIAVNARLDEAAEVVTYVGASDFDYGKGEGQLLAQALPQGGDVAVILGPLGSTPQVQRLAGLKEAIQDRPDIRIVATPNDDFDSSKNLAVTQDLLTKYPRGELAAVVAQGPQMYVGADYAFKNGRSEVKFIAGDYSQQVEESIRSGAMYGTVNQSPELEGQLGVRYAHAWLTGKQDDVPRPEHLIDLPAITRENVDANPSSWSN